MAHDALQIANWFIRRARRDGRTFALPTLLKILYIAHGWHLEGTGQPLFTNRIEAWRTGPVIPDVYGRLRRQGSHPSIEAQGLAPTGCDLDDDFLEQIYGIYGNMTFSRLSALANTEGGPCETAISWGGVYAPIPNDLIRAHYIVKRRQSEEAESARSSQTPDANAESVVANPSLYAKV